MAGYPPRILEFDICSQFQTLPTNTAVCWRRTDGLLDVHPPEDTVFRKALRSIQFTFAIKMRLPRLRHILIDRPSITTMTLPGLSHSVPIIQSTDKLPNADHTLSTAIIRDEEALVVWTRGRVYDLLSECRVLEHRVQHYGGFCACRDLAELPTDMLPILPNSASQDLDALLTADWSAIGASGPEPLSGDPNSPGATTSSLQSLADLPSLYSFTSGESLFDLSVFEPLWGGEIYCGPGSHWDDEVVYRSSARDAKPQKESMGPPSLPPPGRPAFAPIASPFSSPSSSSSSYSPPPSSSCPSSTLTTPQTVSLSDISPAPPPAPFLIDSDSEMSSEEEDSVIEISPALAAWAYPHRSSPEPSPEPPSPMRVTRAAAASSRQSSLGVGSPGARGRRAEPPVASTSMAASTSTSRKRKAPSTPSRSVSPSVAAVKRRKLATPPPVAGPSQPAIDSDSPLTSVAEFSDADADGEYEVDSGAGEDSDDEYLEAQRPSKRPRLTKSKGKGKAPQRRRRRRAPPPSAPAPALDIEEDDEAEDESAPEEILAPYRVGRGGKSRWFCPRDRCKTSFSRSADAERHIKSACEYMDKTKRDQFACDGRGEGGCNKIFNREDAMVRHMKGCPKVPFHVRDALVRQSKRLRLYS